MKFKFGAEGMPQVNPDRVKFEKIGDEINETVVEHPPVTELVPAWDETHAIPASKQWRYFGADRGSVVKGFRIAALSSLAATLLLNIGEEHTEGGNSSGENLSEALANTSSATLLESTEEEVCRLIDGDFMHRFSTLDEEGNEMFNAGAFVVPFAVSLTEDCKTKIDIEFNVPYHFARTFREISEKNPEAREEMVTRLATFIQQQVQNELVIRGVAGVTDTLMVWDRKENVVYTGTPRVDLGNLQIDDLRVQGNASAEAERSIENAGPASLTESNHENIVLAMDRRDALTPFLQQALEEAGFGGEDIGDITNLSYEHNLIESDVQSLAAISEEIFGETLPGTVTDMDRAYQLVQEYNDGNPVVMRAIEENPDYRDTLTTLLDSNRGVDVTITAQAETQKETVYPVVLLLPLLLLALGRLRGESIPGGTRTVRHRERVIERAVPNSVVKEAVGVYDAKRRLFSETTPQTLQETRSFDDVYENAQVRYEDKQTLIDHLLLEEVLPSLDESTREPYIDYEELVNRNRQYLSSDARDGGIEKGSYDTTPEAERHITEDLIEMWERHDAYLYPMQGIDVKSVLNYRHSDQVVLWAKTLAEVFVHTLKQTVTTTEFKELLKANISEAQAAGFRDRNKFVQSSI
jgi:hypothetical protein